MKRFATAWGAALALALAAPAVAAAPAGAQVGSVAPTFTAPASLAGHTFTFSLAKALAKGPVVVYFYPAAYTQGCDIEAHTFSTHHAAFAKAGATIIGVSQDSIATLNKFSSDPDYCAGKFPVASDPQGKVGARYGVGMTPAQQGVTNVKGLPVTHGFFARTTFVLDKGGKVVARFSSAKDHISPAQHVTRSLAIVQKMQAQAAR
ncbi:MAG TPA: peroxiredoxin [Rhodanobacteraceae bacterium]